MINESGICPSNYTVVKGISGDMIQLNQTYQGFSQSTTIDLQDVLQGVQHKYWVALLVFASYLLVYVLFNCFIEVKSEKWLWLKPAMTEWAIIPAVFLFVIILSQVIGFEGI